MPGIQKRTRQIFENIRLAFFEARSVFYDENAQLIADSDHSIDEERFILLGQSAKFRILIVCHCYRENDELIRIISARRATTKERRSYPG